MAGDEVLRNTGHIISRCIREGVDSGYRYGGDEFAIILIDADLDIAKEIGERIDKACIKSKHISVSIGYSRFTVEMSAEDIVAEADKNLYKAKIGEKSDS